MNNFKNKNNILNAIVIPSANSMTHIENRCKKAVRTVITHTKFKHFVLLLLLPVFLFPITGFIQKNPEQSYFGVLNTNLLQFLPLKNETGKRDSLPTSGIIAINNKIDAIYQNTAPLQKAEHLEKQSLPSKNMPGKIYRNITASSQERPNFIENISRTEIISLMPHLAKDKYRSATRKSYSKRKKAITPYVNRYADKFGLDRNLIMSIIEVESNFIPQALSKQNAHGLMQVVPNTAAAEVNRFFKHKQEITDMELMHPENNIYYGTAYLYLIKKYHLNGITDHDSLNSLLIASYNAGSSAVLRHFGETKEKAIRAINAMSPQEVYNSLIQNYRSGETREYLKRVTENLS